MGAVVNEFDFALFFTMLTIVLLAPNLFTLTGGALMWFVQPEGRAVRLAGFWLSLIMAVGGLFLGGFVATVFLAMGLEAFSEGQLLIIQITGVIFPLLAWAWFVYAARRYFARSRRS